MVIISVTWIDVLLAAPLGFLVGLFVGIVWGSKYEIVIPRRREDDKRDYGGERGYTTKEK